MKLPKQSSTYISIWVSLLWLIFIFIGFYYFFSNDISVETMIFWAQDYIRSNLFIWICLFIGIYIMRPLFFIPASPFDFFSWMVFWPFLGFAVSSVSTLLSTMFSYWVWYFTWGIVLEKKNFKKLKKLKEKLRENTFQTTFMMRLLMLPFDLSNYICWVLQAPYIKYVSGTWIGVQGATVVFVWAGAAFYGKDINNFETLTQNVNYTYLMFSSAFFITIIIVSKVVKKRSRDLSI
jgi:uncharacterized membrane protein YdjX (TVP38/TMEM64 family)